jgi:hypothetical protein
LLALGLIAPDESDLPFLTEDALRLLDEELAGGE